MKNGFRFSIDFGPMFRLQQNTNFIDDGEDDDVDRDERDNSIDDIHGESWTFWGAGTGIIGYSF